MNPIGLNIDSCRGRQDRLRGVFAAENLAAAVLLDARHVHYFTGHWTRGIWPSALVVHRAASRQALLFCGVECGWPVAADEVVRFRLSHAGTLVDQTAAAAWQAVVPHVSAIGPIGIDVAPPIEPALSLVSIDPALRTLRRAKDADEVALLRRGVEAAEAAYARVREILKPGLREIDIYAEVIATAARTIGELIGGEIGNDFRSGAGGGSPRNREIEAGELLPLDLGIPVRGYTADLCRTFCVGGEPSALQRAAHGKVVETLAWVESRLRPGAVCAELHNSVERMLGGFRGLACGHHLGHGIGLDVHEAPRLNNHWNDLLQPGDVVTVEPGLYGNEIRGGIRIENDYVITTDGFERLSNVTMEL